MKKLLQIPLLLVALFLTSIPISAHDFEVDGIYYNITSSTNKTIEVTYFGTSSYRSYSGSVVIPDIVTYSGTTYSVTSIGRKAFYYCSGLTSITIPYSVTSISELAFMDCSNLAEVNITDLSAWCKIKFDTNRSNPLIYSGKLNLNGVEITNLIIPSDIAEIKDCVFCNCRSLTSVTIPNSVTEIGSSAFEGCTGLTSVTIPNSVTEIGSSAFEGCTGLTSVTIPNSVTSIEYSVFKECSSLTSVTIPNSVTSIGSSAFDGCTGLTSVTIPNSVTEIGSFAFEGCTGLNGRLIIGDAVTTIGSGAFGGCTNVSEFIVKVGNPNYFSYEGVIYRMSDSCPLFAPAGIVYKVPHFIDKVFLYSNSGFDVKSVIIPEGSAATSVNVGSYCASLESLVINEPLDTIIFHGKNLEKAINLKKLILPTKMDCKSLEIHQTKRIESNSGGDSYTYTFHPIEILQVPKLNIFSYIRSYQQASYVSDHFTIVNGYSCSVCENSHGTQFSVFLPRSLKQLILTDQTDFYNDTYKCWYGFGGMGAIDGYSIDILKPVTNFQNTTFQNSAVRTVAIDSAEIPTAFFKGCANLKSLTLPFPGTGTAQTTSNFGELFGTESNSSMRAVTQYFEDGTNKTYYLPTGLEELVLTEGCEMIPYGGLYNCNMLKKLTLPTSLYMVGDKALYGCAQIADIYCKGADPAVAYDSSFDGMRLTSCKLHVPYNSSERYKISDGWKRFYYIEEEAPLVVSIAKNIENAGVVYGINEYQPGQVAEVEAVAHSGYTFVGWYENGNLLTTDSKYTVMVTDSHSLVAMFAPVLNGNNVVVAPQNSNVTLSWAQETGAAYYNVDIYSNAAMTMLVGSLVVDNNGKPVPSSASTEVSATIEGLSEMQNYYYSITVYGAEETILSKYTGSFSTNAGVEGVMGDTNAVEMARYDIHGRLLSAPVKGINIVKMSDGSTRKEIVK